MVLECDEARKIERERERQEISELARFGPLAESAIKTNARRIPFHDPTGVLATRLSSNIY